MPYNVTPSAPPAMTSSGQWMSIAQIISGLVGGNDTPPPSTPNQSAALSAGQGPLSTSAADAWNKNFFSTFSQSPAVEAMNAPTPGYNTNQFGVPLGTQQQSNSY